MLLGAWLNCTWRQQQQWKFTVQQLLFTPKLKNLKLWSHQTTNHLGLVWATILTCHRKQTLTLTSELLKQTHMQQEWCQQVVSLQLVDRRCWGWMGRRDVCQICRILTLKYWFCDERIWLCRLRAEQCCTESRNLSAPEVKPGETLQLLCIQARFPSVHHWGRRDVPQLV